MKPGAGPQLGTTPTEAIIAATRPPGRLYRFPEAGYDDLSRAPDPAAVPELPMPFATLGFRNDRKWVLSGWSFRF